MRKELSGEKIRFFSRLVKDHLEKTAYLEQDYSQKLRQYGFLATPYYRYLHTLQVLEYAFTICQGEGGRGEVVILAALFHDLERFTTAPLLHGLKGAHTTSRILQEHGFSNPLISRVSGAISRHVGQRDLQQLSLEGAILVEADRLDKLGNKGIMVQFIIGGRSGEDFQELLADYQVYLLDRGREDQKIFRTETGKGMLQEKIIQQECFLKGLKEDLVLDEEGFLQKIEEELLPMGKKPS